MKILDAVLAELKRQKAEDGTWMNIGSDGLVEIDGAVDFARLSRAIENALGLRTDRSIEDASRDLTREIVLKEAVAQLREMAKGMRRVALKVGPAHCFWDDIFEAEAIVLRHKAGAPDTTAPEIDRHAPGHVLPLDRDSAIAGTWPPSDKEAPDGGAALKIILEELAGWVSVNPSDGMITMDREADLRKIAAAIERRIMAGSTRRRYVKPEIVDAVILNGKRFRLVAEEASDDPRGQEREARRADCDYLAATRKSRDVFAHIAAKCAELGDDSGAALNNAIVAAFDELIAAHLATKGEE